MKKKIIFNIIEDCYEGERYHKIVDKDDNTVLFSCSNLSECPEDAIIGRDLFDGEDYIEAVEFGMRLAREGYTEIELEINKEEE